MNSMNNCRRGSFRLIQLAELVMLSGFLVILWSCSAPRGDEAVAGNPDAIGKVEAADILAAESNNSDWLTHGRTYAEQRYSPLAQINRETVSGLKLDWFADLDTARGQEATPLVIDGRIYITTAWSLVKAYDARTGEPVWEYDPEVPGATGVKACCDVVNRGLAAWGDKLYLGTLDGRLVALDRETGVEVWSTMTVDAGKPYTITGAPRVANGMVFIGNGGADMGAIRGYVSAFDAESGEQLWRFYTVPDNPENGPQPEYLETAAETWTGDWWKLGGGGTVWDSMAYDSELDLLYIGVGNGAPWNRQFRSPQGGDNLYLSSILAIKAATGEYAWHFQTTPGDTWDYTATQHIMLADMEIDGAERKVLMQAPKNGFFYVLDRATGEFISANNYTKVNWAKGINSETGRPIESPTARYTAGTAFITPSALGGHNWHPMAMHPEEGLVYIPAQSVPMPYSSPDEWSPKPIGSNTAVGRNGASGHGDGDITVYKRPETAPTEPAEAVADENMQPVEDRKIGYGALVAWDPATQSARWQVDYPGIWNGGLLATGGGLVLQGTAVGDMKAYSAADGEELWSYPIQTGAIAPPITYELDGKQYVAIVAGWGGVYGLLSGATPNHSRLLVFSLDGRAELPPLADVVRVLDPPKRTASAEVIAMGAAGYSRFCGTCHAGGGIVPDLRYSGALEREETWQMIVKDGALEANGMVSFADVLSEDEISAIRHFMINNAHIEKERLEKLKDK